MGFALDHVVIAVNDLEKAVADYQSLGFTVFPGGVHHGGISHNALIVFADGSYFEIIAYRQPAPTNAWWQLLTDKGEGIVDFALVPDKTENDIAAARARGLDLEGPTPGGRLRPDGVRLDWLIVRPSTRDLPFWCGDVTPRELRVPEGEHRKHANGALGIASVGVNVADVSVSADRYRALLGPAAVRQGGPTVQVTVDASTIELADILSGTAIDTRNNRGEGIASVVLRGSKPFPLDPDRLHGAPLSISRQ